MKEIELPLTQTFSLTVDTHKLDVSKAVDIGGGRLGIPLGTVVDQDILVATETARKNGGKVLYATTSIEHQLEAILLLYFMGPFIEHSERRVMFESEILQSSALSFSAKKELFTKVANSEALLPGKKKNAVQSHLKKIMDWRNAFAHGNIGHDNIKGCFLRYYSGTPKTLRLSDEYWTELENCYKECSALLKEAMENLEARDSKASLMPN